MKPRLKSVSDQVLVLTGATSGIGLATVRMAARRGASLVLVARNEAALRRLVDEMEASGTAAICVVADVGVEAEVRAAAEKAIERFGRIDTWVNNAGVGIFGCLEEVSLADQRRVFETNFWGVVHGSLAAAPHLKRSGGALVNVGSAFSDRAAPLQGIYSASKHAVKGFTDSLRMELEAEGAGVSVTLIKPAAMHSMFIDHARNYLAVEPRLPPPVYAPDLVAEAILHAAEHPTRDLYVGGAAKLLALGGHYMPRILDLGMERLMFRLQRTDRPAHDPHRNNLHGPGDDLLERGIVDGTVLERSWYTQAVTRPGASRTVLLGAALALAALWQARRVRRGT